MPAKPGNKIYLLYILSVVTGCAAFNQTQNIPSLSSINAVAHQGCSNTYQGNTENAIRCAINNKASYIEIDLRSTSDGRLYLFHDRRISSVNLKTSADADGRPFNELPSIEIEKSHYHDGSKILNFETALQILHGTPSRLYLDMKSSADYRRVYELVKTNDRLASVVFACYRIECVKFFNDKQQSGSLMFSARVKNSDELMEAIKLNPQIIQVDPDWITAEMITEIHNSGAQVLIKALGIHDQPQGWNYLIELGADLIMTDDIEGWSAGFHDCTCSTAATNAGMGKPALHQARNLLNPSSAATL